MPIAMVGVGELQIGTRRVQETSESDIPGRRRLEGRYQPPGCTGWVVTA